jgi:hypothetical protein
MYLIALISVEGIITKEKKYKCIGETENYFIIKNDINKHECVRKYFFIKE